MSELSTIIEGHQEQTVRVSQWTLRVTSYRCGDKFVCIVNNLDPRATICRVCGPSREEASRQALEQTNHHLSRTEMVDLPEFDRHEADLGMILVTGEHRYSYSVDEFLELPIAERMNHILSGSLTFFDNVGAIMNSGEAMQRLHAASMS